MKIVIIGGVAGGASAAARARRLNESNEIVMLERGEFVSFANCGLPYYIGEKIIKKEALIVATPKSFKEKFNIDVRTHNEVIGIDTNNKCITVRKTKEGTIYEESYDKLILSTGAEPIRPQIKGSDSGAIFTVRSIPGTFKIKEYISKENPKSVVIIGGGYVGIELAENLKEIGMEVTMIEKDKHLISQLDFDIAKYVQSYLQTNGIKLMIDREVKKIEKSENALNIILEKDAIEADMIIMAIGVEPDTKLAKEANIKTNERGAIIVNDKMQTNIEDIYAVGDAIEVKNFVTNQPSFIPLAGPANKQGRIAADNICGVESHYKGTQGSSILKIFDMTVAMTGINETLANRSGIEYDKVYVSSASHASYYPNSNNMMIKVIFEKNSGKLLGTQIVGFDGVDKRMDVISTAIRLKATIYDLTELELCYAPPFSSAKDPVNMVGFVGENVLKGKVKQFFWNDVDNLPRDNSVTLIDVRSEKEFLESNIRGFINIPLNKLRENIDKIDKTKTIYLHCKTGVRSYLACRILTDLGYDCYNLAGGYELYEMVTE